MTRVEHEPPMRSAAELGAGRRDGPPPRVVALEPCRPAAGRRGGVRRPEPRHGYRGKLRRPVRHALPPGHPRPRDDRGAGGGEATAEFDRLDHDGYRPPDGPQRRRAGVRGLRPLHRARVPPGGRRHGVAVLVGIPAVAVHPAAPPVPAVPDGPLPRPALASRGVAHRHGHDRDPARLDDGARAAGGAVREGRQPGRGRGCRRGPRRGRGPRLVRARDRDPRVGRLDGRPTAPLAWGGAAAAEMGRERGGAVRGRVPRDGRDPRTGARRRRSDRSAARLLGDRRDGPRPTRLA